MRWTGAIGSRWAIRARCFVSLFSVAVIAAAVVPAPRPEEASRMRSAAGTFATPIQHVVILYMENHTFDNVLGYMCVQDLRCDGATTGQTADGKTVPLARAPDIVIEMGHSSGDQRLGDSSALLQYGGRISAAARFRPAGRRGRAH